MKFFVNYGFDNFKERIAIEAKSAEIAEDWAYNESMSHYESYAGLYGVLSREDIAAEFEEEFGKDIDDIECEAAYYDHVMYCLDYGVDEFDFTNVEHLEILRKQKGIFFLV